MTQGVPHGEAYNAAVDLIGRNIKAGRGDKTAFIDHAGEHSYADVERLSNRAANMLRALGLHMEQRVLMCMLDTVDFPACFLGAIKAGIVPVPVNTRLTPKEYAFMLDDSRARCLIVSDALYPTLAPQLAGRPFLEHVIVAGEPNEGAAHLATLMQAQPEDFAAAPTVADDICFWLYTSGTTGMPKGAVHLHSHLAATADLYASQVLGIREDDVVFSAAKLFFAYGLGNALTFPMSVGATTVLHAGPPDPKSVNAILRDRRPSIFYGVPTLFGMLLASDDLPGKGEHGLRICTSAGEALPADILRRWKERTGVDIIDGIGSTEMLHIFLSNRPDDIRPGTTGKPVPGYELRLVDDNGHVLGPGEMGALEVAGPTAAVMYWNQREKSRDTFLGRWTRTGDKYTVDDDGYFAYAGRNDDMLKVGGIYVSPFEVEGAILKHDKVLEAAVVGHPDPDGLIKPKAFVVPREGVEPSDVLAKELIEFVAGELAAYKRPRWVEFATELPKTATGKIQRFKLRATG